MQKPAAKGRFGSRPCENATIMSIIVISLLNRLLIRSFVLSITLLTRENCGSLASNRVFAQPRSPAALRTCVDDPVEARAIWYVRRGRVRSCVRPTLRGPRTAGPDAIRSLAPKQIYALEWRITLGRVLPSSGFDRFAITPPSPSSPVSCGNC